MKVLQRVRRVESSEVEVEFPAYVQYDVGDESTYVSTYRCEFDASRPASDRFHFRVTGITRTDEGFTTHQRMTDAVAQDLCENRVSAAVWRAEVEAFERWAAESLKVLREELPR